MDRRKFRNYTSYVERVAKDGSWGNDITLQAAAALFFGAPFMWWGLTVPRGIASSCHLAPFPRSCGDNQFTLRM